MFSGKKIIFRFFKDREVELAISDLKLQGSPKFLNRDD